MTVNATQKHDAHLSRLLKASPEAVFEAWRRLFYAAVEQASPGDHDDRSEQ